MKVGGWVCAGPTRKAPAGAVLLSEAVVLVVLLVRTSAFCQC